MKKYAQEMCKKLQEMSRMTKENASTAGEVRKSICAKIKSLHKKKPIECPHCKCEKVYSKGRYKGGHRYSCTRCGKSFNDLTGTAFHGIRKLDLMLEFMETDFFNGTAVRKVGAKMGIDHRTVFFWRHKIDSALLKLEIDLPEEIIAVHEMSRRISLKGSRHEPGMRYADEEVKIWELHGATHVAGMCAVDNGNHTRVLSINTGRRIDEFIGGLIMKKWLKAGKRVVVGRFGVMYGVGSGRRRVVEALERGGAYYERWRNLERAEDSFHVALVWGMKFHGVATKYLNNYYAIISWYLEHYQEINWFDNLLTSVLLNRNTTTNYRKKKKLKVE